MKTLRLYTCVLSILLLAFAVPAAAAQPTPDGQPRAGAAKACGSLAFAQGRSIVRARNVACTSARAFVRAYLNRDCSETRDCGRSRVRFRGYSCVESRSRTHTKSTCTRGRKVISELHA